MDIATLERLTLENATAIRQLREQRTAIVTRETQVRPARTSEVYAGGLYSYPASPADYLPIVFTDHAVSGTTTTWTDRSSTAIASAISPFGWLPPELDVWVAYDGRRWRIIRIPPLLHGVASTELSAAAWASGCATYTFGYGNVQIWRQNGTSGVYAAQEYADGDPVLLPVKNLGTGEVEADTMLMLGINADNEWVVMVEPCDGACT